MAYKGKGLGNTQTYQKQQNTFMLRAETTNYFHYKLIIWSEM